MHASLLLFIACVVASPLVVHEKRDGNTDDHWRKLVKLDSAAIIPLRIGLKQSNLELGDGWLMDIADPASPNYGNHWTAEQVIDAFKPSHETIKTVHDWLNDAGIDSARHALSEGLNWLELEITVEEAKALMNADYHIFTHKDTNTRHIACDSYSVPEHVQSHIDFISPGVHFDAKIRPGDYEAYDEHGNKLAKRQGNPWWPGKHHWPGPRPHGPPWHPQPNNPNICNASFVTPFCIRTLYQVPNDLTPAEGNSVGVVEYTPETFLQSDLDLFFSHFEPQAVGEAPKFDSIDGGFLYRGYNETTSFQYLGEPSLDLQYAMALLYPQVSDTNPNAEYELTAQMNVVLYQVGDLAEAANTSFNNFLDAIDKSYCTYDGGDVKGIDAVYPDPYPGPHSYKGKEDCGTYAPAKVISSSYGYNENQLPASYEKRQCNEYLKLGLMGVTFTYATGDYGVATYGNQCIGPKGRFNNGTSGKFVGQFPTTCPWVLAVGATQIRNGTKNVVQQVQAGKEVEVAMELYLSPDGLISYDVPPGANTIGQQVFSSSGGYSYIFTLPSYQKAAVTSYNEKYRPSYPGQYNAGDARAYPDISSNGAWLPVAIDGNITSVFGTSCAAPTVGALLGLINGERLKLGKKSVGFINPALYAHPEVLNDITAGKNPGCGTNGFTAVPGWDPVTGLGTPNFPKMLDLFKSLP